MSKLTAEGRTALERLRRQMAGESVLAIYPGETLDDAFNASDVDLQTMLTLTLRLEDIISRAYLKLSCVVIERSANSTPEIVRVCDNQAMGILSEGLPTATCQRSN